MPLDSCTNVGAGSFGAVKKCKYEGRYVAVKTMSKIGTLQSVLGLTAQQLFDREVAALEALRGAPNILQLVYSSHENGQYTIVTEFAKGTRLDGSAMRDFDFVKKCSRKPQKTRKILTSLSTALGYMHKLGMVHSDVKPDNIFVDNDGTATLIDVGGACADGRVRGVPRCQGIIGVNIITNPQFSDPAIMRAVVGERFSRLSMAEMRAGDVMTMIAYVNAGLPRYDATGLAGNMSAISAYTRHWVESFRDYALVVCDESLDKLLREMIALKHTKRPVIKEVSLRVAKDATIRPVNTDERPALLQNFSVMGITSVVNSVLTKEMLKIATGMALGLGVRYGVSKARQLAATKRASVASPKKVPTTTAAHKSTARAASSKSSTAKTKTTTKTKSTAAKKPVSKKK